MNQPKRGFDAHAVDGTLHQADKRCAAINTELNLQQDIWLTGPKGCCGPLIDAQRNGGTEPIGRVVVIGDDFSLHCAHDYLAVGDNLQARSTPSASRLIERQYHLPHWDRRPG